MRERDWTSPPCTPHRPAGPRPAGSVFGGIPYFRQDRDDPAYSVCPKCGERVGPNVRKDFESFDTSANLAHLQERHGYGPNGEPPEQET